MSQLHTQLHAQPQPTPTLILGDFPTETDLASGEIFSGSVGQELKTLLASAGFTQASFTLANLFPSRPYKSNILSWCGSKKECGKDYSLPPLLKGKYLLPQYASQAMARVSELLSLHKPNLVLTLGLSASWALTGSTGISSIRGTVQSSPLHPGLKILPTYHPSSILRQWELRPVLLADLGKAKRESESPLFVRPRRELWLDPTLDDLETFLSTFILPSPVLGVDIETALSQVTHISFAPSPSVSLCVPFLDSRKPGGSYWPDLESEVLAWEFVRKVLQLPKRFVFQNGVYDLQWLWKKMGITLGSGQFFDTMLAHHALYPEMEKSLGFLGSIYTNESSWKLLRKPQEGKANE